MAEASHSTETSGPEIDLRLSLACPKCGATGWTTLHKLSHGMRCPKCQCQFLVGSGGKLIKHSELTQVRYACPRCRKSGTIPAQFPLRSAHCGTCQLKLVAGPDQKLYGEQEAARRHRAANAAAATWRKRLKARLADDDGRPRVVRIGAILLLLASLAAAGVWLAGQWLSPSLESRPVAFTRTCLSGKWHLAEQFLADDAVARAEFDRWRIRHFSSILDRIRPEGDRVTI